MICILYTTLSNDFEHNLINNWPKLKIIIAKETIYFSMIAVIMFVIRDRVSYPDFFVTELFQNP